MPNKQLDKTLKVNNETYDVNAIYSDEAGKTSNTLTIINQLSDTTEETTFDGSKDANISVVSAEDGGKFLNPIEVPTLTSLKSVTDDSVLSYKNILDIVGQLTGASLFKWQWNEDAETGTLTSSTKDKIPQRLGIVIGMENALEAFSIKNQKEDILSTYLYIAQIDDTAQYNLYYGTATQDIPFKVGGIADKANKLAIAQRIHVDLEKNTAPASMATFDGSSDQVLCPGVYGTLSVSNGGTGSTSPRGACNNLIKDQDIAPGTIVINTPDNNSQDAYKHKQYGKFGIDLKNSDIVGLNALYFADVSDSRSECINFVNTPNENDELTTYDRFYSRGGILYYQPNKKISDDYAPGRYEVYHGGTRVPEENGGTGKASLSEVTVGKANTLSVGNGVIATAYSSKITISKNIPGNTTGNNGDIWIVYSETT